MIKCKKCDVELFKKDIVDYKIEVYEDDEEMPFVERIWEKYRCPKCFTIIKKIIKNDNNGEN